MKLKMKIPLLLSLLMFDFGDADSLGARHSSKSQDGEQASYSFHGLTLKRQIFKPFARPSVVWYSRNFFGQVES